jgi:uncharacterized protein
VSLYYIGTSAVIKLLVEESHSKAFAAFYDAHADAEWVSSALLRIELTRAVTRTMPALLVVPGRLAGPGLCRRLGSC